MSTDRHDPRASPDEARRRDADDPAPARDRFALLPWPGGDHPHLAYLAGNSLGLQPVATRSAIGAVLDEWAALGVTGWFTGDRPWMNRAEALAAPMAGLVGALPHEVVVMGSLTVNLHLLLAALHHPTPERSTVLIESGAFPSDEYAIASHLRSHGIDPDRAVVHVRPREGEDLLRTEDLVTEIERIGPSLSLVLLPAIAFRTGQLLDVPAITAAAHRVGALAAWDLAHAAGNVTVPLHDAGVDFAVWCTYKYLNAGPGAIGAAFVHERHHQRADLTPLRGWWGEDPATRFEMAPHARPAAGAAGWQVSTPPVLQLAALEAALTITDAIGMDALRARSLRLTGHLEVLLDELTRTHRLQVVTPRDPAWRGAQLSIRVDDAVGVTESLIGRFGVVPDERPPDIVRLAPAPLYSSYEDVARAVDALASVLPHR